LVCLLRPFRASAIIVRIPRAALRSALGWIVAHRWCKDKSQLQNLRFGLVDLVRSLAQARKQRGDLSTGLL
jgi:hypothetical protein